MNKFEYKKLTPFKWFVLENFPFIEADFDALTSYQLWCKVVEYLNKTIDNMNLTGEQMENVTNAMTELQNYFDNLDVQEEINNKLDEMTEDGTLQEIISNYLNTQAIFVYNSVQEMKNATNLINNSNAKTLGFYSKNDGGNAFYKIREMTNTDIIDNKSLIPMSNGLVAELIFEKEINVRQFGAKGDGETDDTESFQKCFDFIKNLNIENPYVNTPLIKIDTGKYLITSKLEMSILCKIKVSGNPVLLSNVENDTTLHIFTNGLNERYSGLSYMEGSMFEQGGIIDGIGKLIIQKINIDTNNLNNNSIGLEIGDRSSISNVPIARSYVKNVSIAGFNAGLKINAYNFYIFDFDNIMLTMNTKNIVYGNGANVNSGEKISFLNCTIAQAYNGIEINSSGHFNFKNCSFDYLANGLLINIAQKTILNFQGCHFEKYGNVGIGINATEENTIGFGNIIYCNYAETWGLVTAIFDACNLFMRSSDLIYPLFNTRNSYSKTYANLNIILNSNTEFISPTKLTDDIFIAKNSVDIKAYLSKEGSNAFLLSKENDNKIGTLSLVDDSWADHSTDTDGNNLDLQNLGYKILCINAGYNGVNWSVDTTNKVFDKSIKFTINDDSYPAIERVVKAKQRKILVCGFYKLDELSAFLSSQSLNSIAISSRTIFYNKNGVELDRISHTITLTEENGYTRTNITQASFPDDCDYCEIRHTITGRDSNNNIIRIKGNFEFCGMIVNFTD